MNALRVTGGGPSAIWVDRATARVLRIEQRTEAVPKDFPYSRAECIIDYGFVPIEGKVYLMPEQGENIACMSGSGTCSRNVIAYRNYRKFNVASEVKF